MCLPVTGRFSQWHYFESFYRELGDENLPQLQVAEQENMIPESHAKLVCMKKAYFFPPLVVSKPVLFSLLSFGQGCISSIRLSSKALTTSSPEFYVILIKSPCLYLWLNNFVHYPILYPERYVKSPRSHYFNIQLHSKQNFSAIVKL